jgi:hypothetical protein
MLATGRSSVKPVTGEPANLGGFQVRTSGALGTAHLVRAPRRVPLAGGA